MLPLIRTVASIAQVTLLNSRDRPLGSTRTTQCDNPEEESSRSPAQAVAPAAPNVMTFCSYYAIKGVKSIGNMVYFDVWHFHRKYGFPGLKKELWPKQKLLKAAAQSSEVRRPWKAYQKKCERDIWDAYAQAATYQQQLRASRAVRYAAPVRPQHRCQLLPRK